MVGSYIEKMFSEIPVAFKFQSEIDEFSELAAMLLKEITRVFEKKSKAGCSEYEITDPITEELIVEYRQ